LFWKKNVENNLSKCVLGRFEAQFETISEFLMEISVDERSALRTRIAAISDELAAMESVLTVRGLSRQVSLPIFGQ
jgi:hypothetical protein